MAPNNSTPELIEEFSQSPSLGDDRLLTEREYKAIGYLGDRTHWRDSEQGKLLKSWRAAYAAERRRPAHERARQSGSHVRGP